MMPRKPEPGQLARYEYQPVKYSHFKVGPAASLVLTADPWSYLYAWLTTSAAKTRGKKRRCLERALYYRDLSEDFFKAADSVELPTQATLIYYGFFNLAKCFISSREIELESGIEHHGLVISQAAEFRVVVRSPPKNSISIFHEFARCLGTSISARQEFTVAEVAAQLPEVHEIAHTLDQLPASKRHFVPVEIDFLVNDACTRVFTEIRYEKKSEARIPNLLNSFHKGVRKTYFARLEEWRDGWICFRGKRSDLRQQKSWPRVYATIASHYKRFDLWSLLTRDGYRYYCNLSSPSFHQLCYVMMLMFYLGTTARYRPTEMKKLMEHDLAPVVSEAITICPTQFLYQMVSLTTRSICVRPHAMLE